MSSGLSSDQIIKNQIVDEIGIKNGKIKLRIFPEGSNDDQRPFYDGGLTFGCDGILYGSCDAVWYKDEEYIDEYSKTKIKYKPVIALEGTDALQRGSSGNAQYQRFHHALGAVRIGLIGIYYLRKGKDKICTELYEMAYNASKSEKGTYIITQELSTVKKIIELIDKFGEKSTEVNNYLNELLEEMHAIWINEKFIPRYHNDWNEFAKDRSTIVYDDYIIKYAGRNLRGFADSSQRSGHIAVGEMYLSKYFYPNKKLYYLFLRMFKGEKEYLDVHKAKDKEWNLLRSEKNVEILCVDDLIGVPNSIREDLYKIKDLPIIGGEPRQIYNRCKDIIVKDIIDEKIRIKF